MSNEFVYPTKPQLSTVLNMFGANLSRSINCMLPAEVVSYDAAAGTATVKIMIQRQLVDGRVLDFPPVADCPVFTLNGGGAYMSFPIEAGDPCMVVFADRSIDEWYQSGEARVPEVGRAHSFSDGIVLVGPRPKTKSLNAETDCPTLNGKTKKLRIKNDAKDLKTLMGKVIDLMGQIIQSGNASNSGGPVTWTAPLPVAFTNLKAEFAQLLED